MKQNCTIVVANVFNATVFFVAFISYQTVEKIKNWRVEEEEEEEEEEKIWIAEKSWREESNENKNIKRIPVKMLKDSTKWRRKKSEKRREWKSRKLNLKINLYNKKEIYIYIKEFLLHFFKKEKKNFLNWLIC